MRKNDYKISNLGKHGNFREITKNIKLENMIETKVHGPATGRENERNLKETKINSFLPPSSDDDNSLIDDLEFQLHKINKSQVQQEWRTNPNKYTRYDTDFIDRIESDSELSSSKQQQSRHFQKEAPTNITQYHDNSIGPRFKDKYYINAVIESSADLYIRSTVKEQLEGRVINNNNTANITNDDNTLKCHNINKKRKLSYSNSRKEIALKVFHDKIIKASCNNNEKINESILKEDTPHKNTTILSHLLVKTENNRKRWVNIKRDFHRFMKRVRKRWRTIRKVHMNDDFDNKKEKEEESKLLYDAVDNGELSLAKLALEFGGDVDYIINGKTPFQMIFSRLCRIEASQEYDPLWKKTMNANNIDNSTSTVSTTTASVMKVDDKKSKYNNVKHLMMYYTKKDDGVEDGDDNDIGTTVDYERMIKVLYEYGADINKTDNPEYSIGWSPLHYAANYGNVKRIIWLLNHGANIDILDNTNTNTKSTSTASPRSSSFTINNMTPLMLACKKGNIHVVYTLISYNANIEAKASNGYTVLHFAAMSGFVVLLEFLMECGLDKNALSSDGFAVRPADISKKYGYHSCTELLLKWTHRT